MPVASLKFQSEVWFFHSLRMHIAESEVEVGVLRREKI
jgi:hypothetical protein